MWLAGHQTQTTKQRLQPWMAHQQPIIEMEDSEDEEVNESLPARRRELPLVQLFEPISSKPHAAVFVNSWNPF
jgi:hypothetical protein